jgi:hypothetical protein
VHANIVSLESCTVVEPWVTVVFVRLLGNRDNLMTAPNEGPVLIPDKFAHEN